MIDNYLDIIKSSIAPDTADCSEESEAVHILDEEMDKYGTLHEQSIDWPLAEETALSILKERCKNLRVLAHLMLCLQQSRDGERFVLSIQLLSTFIENFWESTAQNPEPESRALLIKRKILKQILLRSEQAVDRLDLTEGDRALLQPLADTIGGLKVQVENTGLEYAGCGKITSGFEKALPAEVLVQKPEPAPEKKEMQKPVSVQERAAASPGKTDIAFPEIRLQEGNERETRQTLFKVATLLNSAMPHEPLGFRMRRFAIWFNITSMPMLRKDGATEIMAVSSDRVTEYREAQSSAPSEELLMKIEHSVSVSPFWIDGSYLSSRVAEALGMSDVSDAIREETSGFINRLPDLLVAQFSDGTPFVDTATRHWLNSGSGAAEQRGSGSEWSEKLQQALMTAQNGKYKKALSLLEKGASAAEQTRDRFYWRLATADFMHNTDMKSLAKEEYRALLSQAEALNVDAWEPMLVDGLKERAGIAQENKSITEIRKG